MQSFAEQDRSAAATVERDFEAIYNNIREGQFERGLALMAGLSSILSGLEVGYEHYRAGYGNPIMYLPVLFERRSRGRWHLGILWRSP